MNTVAWVLAVLGGIIILLTLVVGFIVSVNYGWKRQLPEEENAASRRNWPPLRNSEDAMKREDEHR